uniref:Secreted protein n=1 Tax=Steinernema glaseri TaxID=37863 RepID=A0A1I7ZE72_9BILA
MVLLWVGSVITLREISLSTTTCQVSQLFVNSRNRIMFGKALKRRCHPAKLVSFVFNLVKSANVAARDPQMEREIDGCGDGQRQSRRVANACPRGVPRMGRRAAGLNCRQSVRLARAGGSKWTRGVNSIRLDVGASHLNIRSTFCESANRSKWLATRCPAGSATVTIIAPSVKSRRRS